MSCRPGIRIKDFETLQFWAQRHKLANKDSFIDKIKKIYKKTPELIENKVSNDAKKFHKMAREVLIEFNTFKGFIHFDLVLGVVLWSKVDSDHDIYDLLLKYFTDKFPNYIICLQQHKTYYIGTKRIDIPLKYPNYKKCYMKLNEPKFKDFLNDIGKKDLDKQDFGEFYESNWEKYYNSQYISNRKNIKLANKIMPLKYKFKLNLQHEFNTLKKNGNKIKDLMNYL